MLVNFRNPYTTGLAIGGVKRTYKSLGEARAAYRSGIKSGLSKDFAKKAIKRDQTAALKGLYKRKQGVAYKRSLGTQNQTIAQVTRSQNQFNKRQSQIPSEQKRVRQRLNQRARQFNFNGLLKLVNFSAANKTNPGLWEQAKSEAKSKMGGKHSARAMQEAVRIYKSRGGGYKGKKKASNSLRKWTKQDWGYSSKKMIDRGRCLPKKAWSKLSSGQKAATNKAKIKGTSEGKQFVQQPKKIANKVRRYRK